MAETQTPAPAAKPSFTKEHEASVAARTAELASVGAPEPTPDTPPADEFDFDKSWNGLDERLRKAAEEKIYGDAYGRYNKAIEDQYGDLLPILVEAQKDPVLRKRLAKLTDKQVRDFLFDQALDVYDKTHIDEPVEGQPKPDATAERVSALESQIDDDRRTTRYEKYVDGLSNEFGALRNEFGDELNFTSEKDPQYKRANHLFKVWETRFAASAARAGVDINRAPHLWVTEALDKGVKAPSYRELYDELHEVEGRTRPPAAPVGTESGPPQVQAPRTASEGKERALKLIQRAGGINGLQASFNARKRGAR